MTRVQDPLHQRIRQIQRKHSKLSQGYVLKVDRNNLIVPHPHHKTLAFPWKALCVAAFVALGFKAYLMMSLDPQSYASKLSALQNGRVFEQAGAWIMQPDPASEAMAQMMRKLRG
ncbi:hypothetical protein ACOI1H_04255 [Loktanella sp. DJP18]|uniref:hypothetical protein n=1 Tax=Loktanella sp. DJP18 TaxID=3409788 RepID=UPI003BB50E81